jgi:hypothetical protein
MLLETDAQRYMSWLQRLTVLPWATAAASAAMAMAGELGGVPYGLRWSRESVRDGVKVR